MDETDCQTALGTYPSIAYTADGKYSLEYIGDSANRLLYFYDNATKQNIIVCSKSNCGHNDEGCDAYFAETEYTFLPYLWYYEDALYTLMCDEDYLCIEKISLDATVREKSCTLFRMNVETEINPDGSESMSTNYPEMQLHRGYVYYSTYYPGCQSAELYRVKLNSDKESELLYSSEGNNPGLYRIKPYGRYILFQMGSFSEDYMEFEGGIYAYDTETGEVTQLCENAIRDYTVVGDCVYYFDLKDNVYCKELETGEVNLFFEIGEDTDMLDASLFGTEKGLVYQLTDWSNEGNTRQILLDYEGEKEPEYIEKQEDLLQPY